MLKKEATLTFFTALAHASSEITGPASALSRAAQDAVKKPSPTTFVRAQEELARLSDDVQSKILSDVHADLRNDIGLIWENLPHAPKSDRPN